jgi:hypothetical protein
MDCPNCRGADAYAYAAEQEDEREEDEILKEATKE